MKFKISAALMALTMLAGCTTAAPAAPDETPAEKQEEKQVEKFNEIQNLIDDNKQTEAFDTMFKATLAAYDNKIEMDNASQGTFIVAEGDEGTTDLDKESANRTADTVTFQQDGTLYFITETADGKLNITTYNDEGGKSADFDLKENGNAILASIGGGSKTGLTAEDRQMNVLEDIFRTDYIMFNPVDNPEYYEFTNNDTGTGMVTSIDIKDLKKFNEDAKGMMADGLEINGHKVDNAQVKMNYFDVTINNEGVIQDVTHVVEIEFTAGDDKETEKYEVTTKIYSYDYDAFNTSEISKIFAGIDDGSLKVGDEVQLTHNEKSE